MPRLFFNRLRSLTISHSLSNGTLKNVTMATAIRQQKRLLSKSEECLTSTKQDFREMGKQKDAGALQDLLRRVQEIDAMITNTPIEEFKPNTQYCVAYCIADGFNMSKLRQQSSEFESVSNGSEYSNMNHLIDRNHGGDIFVFSNGSFTCWGMDEAQQSKFLAYISSLDMFEGSTFKEAKSRESIRYTVDEDELTKFNGDVILLNPHVPSIELSKAAFSYGLGRAAKLTSIEYSLAKYMEKFDGAPAQSEADEDILVLRHDLESFNLLGQLLMIRKKMMRSAQDGFLGTSEFKWQRPELQDYVTQMSQRFNTPARIEILNKQIDFAKELISFYEKYEAQCNQK